MGFAAHAVCSLTYQAVGRGAARNVANRLVHRGDGEQVHTDQRDAVPLAHRASICAWHACGDGLAMVAGARGLSRKISARRACAPGALYIVNCRRCDGTGFWRTSEKEYQDATALRDADPLHEHHL